VARAPRSTWTRGEEFDNLPASRTNAASTEKHPLSELWNNVFIQYNRIDRIPSILCHPNMSIPA